VEKLLRKRRFGGLDAAKKPLSEQSAEEPAVVAAVTSKNLIRKDWPELWNRGMLAGDGYEPQAADRGVAIQFFRAGG
jgi:hypothetical protein